MTFWRAQERARSMGGKLILRIEDLDAGRCRPQFRAAIVEDLAWFGISWDEGPYLQSDRRREYVAALDKLRASGLVYPCRCSRRDAEAGLAPHRENDEPIYPGMCRPGDLPPGTRRRAASARPAAGANIAAGATAAMNWRFRVPEGDEIEFLDVRLRQQRAVAGKDFGDFIVWGRDDTPAYQLAVVVDDAAMGISEIVRGEDLLLSTFRQLLVYRALRVEAPRFYHVPLILDGHGKRLAKRDAAMSLRALREAGVAPGEIRASMGGG
jgi:glutamyl/glutaminyl-tRNA synthetase